MDVKKFTNGREWWQYLLLEQSLILYTHLHQTQCGVSTFTFCNISDKLLMYNYHEVDLYARVYQWTLILFF